MPEVRELISFLQTQHKPDDVMACSFWTIADVRQVARELGKVVSDEDAADILAIAHECQDVNTGINLGFIEFVMNNYLNETKS